jgi:Polyketide cyclase / dehydrase and lipid transport
METTSEVVEYEPSTKYTRKGRGPIPITGSFTFESATEGTKVIWTFKMQPGGFFALAEPLVTRSFRRQLEAGLGDVKELLESRVAAFSRHANLKDKSRTGRRPLALGCTSRWQT